MSLLMLGVACGEDPSEKSVRIAIIGYDATLDTSLGFAEYARRFGYQGNSHAFYAPSSRDQTGITNINAQHAVKHETAEADLPLKIETLLKTSSTKNVTIFLASHGARGTGHICYHDKNRCSFSGSIFARMLKKIDDENLTKQIKIERIAIISNACFSKLFADEVKQQLMTLNGVKSFSLAMVHMEHVGESWSNGAPDQIFDQRIEFWDTLHPRVKKPLSFEQWLSENNRQHRLFNLVTLHDLLAIHREASPKSRADITYTVSIIQGKDEDFHLRKLEIYPSILNLSTSAMKEYDSSYRTSAIETEKKKTALEITHLVLRSPFLRARVHSLYDYKTATKAKASGLKDAISYTGTSHFIVSLALDE